MKKTKAACAPALMQNTIIITTTRIIIFSPARKC